VLTEILQRLTTDHWQLTTANWQLTAAHRE